MKVQQLWSASNIRLFSSKDYTPIKLYKKFQQQQKSDTLTEIHTGQLMQKHAVHCHSTTILWDHVESRSNGEHFQLAEPNP